jgi:hypothetical protein
MTQTIDPIKLKAAAEHLEWVLQQYPDSEDVQGLLEGLLPLIREAKAGRIHAAADQIPFAYRFADGAYVPYRNPNVGGAYADFATQMAGGVSDAGLEIEAYIKAKKAAMQGATEQ